jgi:hypothetical protein
MREFEEIVFNCNLAKVKPFQFNLFDGFKHFDKIPKVNVDLSKIFEHMGGWLAFCDLRSVTYC